MQIKKKTHKRDLKYDLIIKMQFSVSWDAMPCCRKDTSVLDVGGNRLFGKLCTFMKFVIPLIFYEINNVECVYWSNTIILYFILFYSYLILFVRLSFLLTDTVRDYDTIKRIVNPHMKLYR